MNSDVGAIPTSNYWLRNVDNRCNEIYSVHIYDKTRLANKPTVQISL